MNSQLKLQACTETSITIFRASCHRFESRESLPCFKVEIIESFGSEGTPRGHLVQHPHSEQGHH